MTRNRNQHEMLETDEQIQSLQAVRKFRKPLIDYLISGLEDPDKWVRILSAELLGTAGDIGVAVHIRPLLVDRDKDLRTAGERTMARILSATPVLSVQREESCDHCMIRHLASEAFEQLKQKSDPAARRP